MRSEQDVQAAETEFFERVWLQRVGCENSVPRSGVRRAGMSRG
jgi:hypothetical protein